MEKVYGSPKRQDGLYKVGRNTWELIYGFGKDEENDMGWNWRQRFKYKPSEEEVKSVIVAQIDANTDDKILTGLKWDGHKVWLSTENQLNYKAAYDMAKETEGKSLPVKFKFGTDEEPHYKSFESVEDLRKFYHAVVKHIQDCIDEGWREKDMIDARQILKAQY